MYVELYYYTENNLQESFVLVVHISPSKHSRYSKAAFCNSEEWLYSLHPGVFMELFQ